MLKYPVYSVPCPLQIPSIHVISPYFGGSSLYFVYFPENLPTKIFRISCISYTSPYLEFQISLPNFMNSLLCLIILPIWKTKSPYLSSGMYHMYDSILKHKSMCHNLCCVFRLQCFRKAANNRIMIAYRLFSPNCPNYHTNITADRASYR